MRLNIKFRENAKKVNVNFGEVHNISDGGFERGYAEGETKGYEKGYTEGEVKGFTDGETVGYNKGYAEGELVSYDKGHADGVKSEYDRFWDNYQQNGERTGYDQAFSFYWTDELFNPKYDLIVKSSSAMFKYSRITDLKDKLESKGLKFDTSQATTLLQVFQGASITHIPEIDARKATNMAYTFGSGCEAVTIDKLIVSENTVLGTTTFNQAGKLENIVIEGTIANPIDMHWSTKLTHDSLMSFINALKNFSGTSETRTCTLGATNLAKLTDAEKAIATEKGWTLA